MKHDLIVVGGGPVATALARAARGMSVALVSREARAKQAPPALPDPRVYSISPGNVGFLRALRAWDLLPTERLTPVHAMRVFGDREGSELTFDAYRAGVSELAWTVEDGLLHDALWQAAASADHVEVFPGATCARLDIEAGSAVLQLADGRRLEGALVAGADGARSFVRESAGIALAERDYGQAAVAASFDCEKGHGNTAFQWFLGGPVLALLPLPGRRVSMIWSMPVEAADVLETLDAESLCRQVEQASRHALGRLSLVSGPRRYPLRRLSARRLVGARVALAGDAAHVLHPLAGQGLNLGLQDARCLAQVLAARAPGRDPGDARLLRRYERRRAEPILAMDCVVDGLFRLFGRGGEATLQLRNTGLNLAGRVPVLKNLLVRHAMS